jgi:Fe-S cluster assembly protein SufD
VIDGEGHGVFDGRIIVHPGAVGTDATQTNKNLLLSESAQAYTRPRLEIFADDVKCAHGAAAGMLDEEALFYLQSRGIHREFARNLLAYAFAREVMDRIQLLPLRSRAQRLLESRFPKIGGEVAA